MDGDILEENDLSGVIDKFSDILKSKDINLNEYIDESITQSSNETSSSTSSENDTSSGFNIDINTLLKFKNIADKLNHPNSNSRSKLLQALKPFLSKEKQGKIEEYIKIVNILGILDALKSNDNNDN